MFTFQELDSSLTSSCGFVLAAWLLRKSANLHILGLCEGFVPSFCEIVYLYGAEEHIGKKERCEPASLWQPVSRLLRRKASKVIAQDVRKKLFRTRNERRKTMKVAWALITRNSHLRHLPSASPFLTAVKTVFQWHRAQSLQGQGPFSKDPW